MRLTFKLTLGILIGVAITLAANAAIRAGRMRQLLESDMKKDHLILGHILAVDILEELRDRGPDAALQVVAKMNAERSALDIAAISADALPVEFRDRLAAAHAVQVLDGEGATERLVTWLPLSQHGTMVFALTLAEPLAPARAEVNGTILRTGVIAVVGLGGSACIAWLFGFFLIGRPVRALVDKARRVGAGDLDGPLSTDRNDELGVLSAELNAMCDRLAAARAELVRAHDARVAALQQLRHSDRLSTVGLLSAGLAHELGTPLNIVAGRARIVADAAGVSAEIKKNGELIEEQAQRMTRIVRQLLDFTRARRPQKSVVDVAALSRDTAEMLAAITEKRGVAVVVDAPDRVAAEVDADQLQQALANLIVNAVQASAPGKIVHLDVRQHLARASIAVVDEGAGMDDATMENLFTPFFTTKDVGQGTGLGLAVAWGLVEENGGHITVHSGRGAGSMFIIDLPAIAA